MWRLYKHINLRFFKIKMQCMVSFEFIRKENCYMSKLLKLVFKSYWHNLILPWSLGLTDIYDLWIKHWNEPKPVTWCWWRNSTQTQWLTPTFHTVWCPGIGNRRLKHRIYVKQGTIRTLLNSNFNFWYKSA